MLPGSAIGRRALQRVLQQTADRSLRFRTSSSSRRQSLIRRTRPRGAHMFRRCNSSSVSDTTQTPPRPKAAGRQSRTLARPDARRAARANDQEAIIERTRRGDLNKPRTARSAQAAPQEAEDRNRDQRVAAWASEAR